MSRRSNRSDVEIPSKCLDGRYSWIQCRMVQELILDGHHSHETLIFLELAKAEKANTPHNGDCPMFRRFYVQKVLCSENICLKGSMFRKFYIQKVLCSEGSMFRRSYVQKVLCSEGPMFRKKMFKRSYIQKVLCSEGPIFRYIEKVLCSENSLFYIGKNISFSFR